MHLILIDSQPDTRAALAGRAQEALRQAGIRRVRVMGVDLENIAEMDWSLAMACLIGPGCYENLEEVISKVQGAFNGGPVGVVLENEYYAAEAVFLRKRHNVSVMSLSDIGQVAGFLIDCEHQRASGSGARRNRGVLSVCQFKGGVGTTTIASAIASCWARHGLNVVAVDLDDVNPQLTAWGRVGSPQRKITSEFLQSGLVPLERVNELVSPVEGYDGKLGIVGQPELYNEAFHFKANVIETAPAASEFVSSLLDSLRNEFDAVVLDLGRSWGVSTFAALPLSQHVLLVTDDDAMSVRRTLDGLTRFKKESDDPEEFDLSRWSLLLNAYTGHLITPAELEREARALELFPPQSMLYSVPFSQRGRQWGGPGQSFYDLAEPKVQQVIRDLAYSFIPFRFQRDESLGGKIAKRWQAFVNPV